VRAPPLAFVLLVLLVGSCRLLGWSDPWERVEGVAWELRSIEGQAPPPGVSVRLNFDAGGRLFGEAGASLFFGTYARSGRKGLRIGRIGSARGTGPLEGVHQQERFLALLADAQAFSLSSGELVLLCEGTPALRFVAEP